MKLLRQIGIFVVATLCISSLTYGKTLESLTVQNVMLIPLRVVSEELNAKVDFDKSTQKISVNYGDKAIILTPGSVKASVNDESRVLDVAPRMVGGTTYVPLRFIGEALGAKVDYKPGSVTIELGDTKEEWTLKKSSSSKQSFKSETKSVLGKQVKCITIDLQNVTPSIQLSGGKINQVSDLKTFGKQGQVAINGTYFAAYNGDTPYPDGTLVKEGNPVHITDIGCTIGFTSDEQVLIDFVKTRVQGYVNDAPRWVSYRMNRPTKDASATVIYTPQYGNTISLEPDYTGVVCSKGKVIKKVTGLASIPQDGFVLVMQSGRASGFNVGDEVRYEVTFEPRYTNHEVWENVENALSAGPSLLINGQKTGDPKDEGFTEAKILTQVASRSFIGITKDQKVMIGTVSASINEMKEIVKGLGLQSAMCLDGGASSGLYYKGEYLTTPGRKISNSIVFKE